MGKFVVMYKLDESEVYFSEGNTWTKDPAKILRFSKEEGTFQVGKLLVEHEWVTKLVPEDVLPKSKVPQPPTNNFFLIVDCDGLPVRCYNNGNADFLSSQVNAFNI